MTSIGFPSFDAKLPQGTAKAGHGGDKAPSGQDFLALIAASDGRLKEADDKAAPDGSPRVRQGNAAFRFAPSGDAPAVDDPARSGDAPDETGGQDAAETRRADDVPDRDAGQTETARPARHETDAPSSDVPLETGATEPTPAPEEPETTASESAADTDPDSDSNPDTSTPPAAIANPTSRQPAAHDAPVSGEQGRSAPAGDHIDRRARTSQADAEPQPANAEIPEAEGPEALAGQRRPAEEAETPRKNGGAAASVSPEPRPAPAPAPRSDGAPDTAPTQQRAIAPDEAAASADDTRRVSKDVAEPRAVPAAGAPANSPRGERMPAEPSPAERRTPEIGAFSDRTQTRQKTADAPRVPDAASQVARDVTATSQFAVPSGQHQAPGLAETGPNGRSLVTAIQHNSGWTKFLSAPVARFSQHAGPGGAVVDVLKIDLHPAELGRMEASLKAQGDRMTITIRVASREAASSLGSDIAGIQAGLRAAGYAVDQVTVEVRGQPGGQPAGQNAAFQNGAAGGSAHGSGGERGAASTGGQGPEMRDGGNGGKGRSGNGTSVSSSGGGYVI